MAFIGEFMTFSQFAMCFAIVLVAAILQMAIGMGFGMLASPLLALVKPEIVPGCVMLIGLVVAFSGAWRERQNISLQEVKMGFGGRIVGSAAAFVILLLITNLDVFLIIFGSLMLIAVIMAASGIRFAFNDRNLFNLSIVSGLMGTITAVGAPPMAIIYHDRPPNIVRPTLNAFFGAGSVLGLLGLAASGWLHADDFLSALLLLPALVSGIYISRYFRNLPTLFLSRILLFLSGLASLLLIFRGVL